MFDIPPAVETVYESEFVSLWKFRIMNKGSNTFDSKHFREFSFTTIYGEMARYALNFLQLVTQLGGRDDSTQISDSADSEAMDDIDAMTDRPGESFIQRTEHYDANHARSVARRQCYIVMNIAQLSHLRNNRNNYIQRILAL